MVNDKALFSTKVIVPCAIGIVILLLISLLTGCAAAPKRPPTTKAEYMDHLAHTFYGKAEKWPEYLQHLCICKGD